MIVSICTTTARKGFAELQASFIAAQKTEHQIQWVLVDFDYENRKESIEAVARIFNLNIIHVPNVRDDRKYVRDISRNRNLALKHAVGDYIIFLDDFAIISKDFVENHVALLKENKISCGHMHRLEVVTDDTLLSNLPVTYEEALFRFGDTMLGKDYRNSHNNENYQSAAGISYTGNLGITRQMFEQLNGFDPRMEGALEDCDFGLRADKMGFPTWFNAKAYTINLNTAGHSYVFQFDHAHDNEPFICNGNNGFRGNDKLTENEFMTVEFCGTHRIAHCKKCGAMGMIDPNELIIYKMNNNEFVVPSGLPGGLDTLRGFETETHSIVELNSPYSSREEVIDFAVKYLSTKKSPNMIVNTSRLSSGSMGLTLWDNTNIEVKAYFSVSSETATMFITHMVSAKERLDEDYFKQYMDSFVDDSEYLKEYRLFSPSTNTVHIIPATLANPCIFIIKYMIEHNNRTFFNKLLGEIADKAFPPQQEYLHLEVAS